MITSLKANNSIRLKRDRFFDKDISGIYIKKNKQCSYIHLSENEILEIREELFEKNKKETLKKITALLIAVILTGIPIFLFINYLISIYWEKILSTKEFYPFTKSQKYYCKLTLGILV